MGAVEVQTVLSGVYLMPKVGRTVHAVEKMTQSRSPLLHASRTARGVDGVCPGTTRERDTVYL